MTPNPTNPSAGTVLPATRATSVTRRPYLYNRWVDFLMLGGGSWVVLLAMAAFYPKDAESRTALAAAMLFVAHFVNHPHFAHSYQIFYRDFRQKAFSSDRTLRGRYRFAGVMVPALLATFCAATLATGSPALLGLLANVMFFTVGWHYAKQGFGILMLDATHKGIRFSARERRNLLWNTHLTWVTYWLLTNDRLAARDYWGLTYFTFDTPDVVLAAMAALSAASGGVVARDMFRQWQQERTLPMNGLIAYVSSVYIWLILVWKSPVLVLVVPALHSLQYLGVVWRRQLNIESEKIAQRPEDSRRMIRWTRSAPVAVARFVVIGGLLGAAGFWWVPEFLNAHAPYDRALFGATVFIFVGWTFINIHHYFIDAVIWRRENEDTRRYLFGY